MSSHVAVLNSLGWLWRENGVELTVNLDGRELRVFVPLGRVVVQFHRELAREGFQPVPRVEGWSVGGLFGDVGKAFKSIGRGATRAVSRAASSITRTASRYGAAALRPIAKYGGAALRTISNNPIYGAIQTGVSFVPGMGSAISAGMGAAAALGRGESLRDAGLAAAKSALPGGPIAASAFDVAVGLAKGQRLDRAALSAARNQLPGGPLAKAAFDAGLAAVTHGPEAALRTLPGSAMRALPSAARALPVPSSFGSVARSARSFGGALQSARSFGRSIPRPIRSYGGSMLARTVPAAARRPQSLSSFFGRPRAPTRRGLFAALTGGARPSRPNAAALRRFNAFGAARGFL